MAVEVKCLVLVYLLFNVCYCSFPVNEVLETVMRLLNGCSDFILTLIVTRQRIWSFVVKSCCGFCSPFIYSLDRGAQANAGRILPLELLVRQIQYLVHRRKMFALRADSCTSVRPIRFCQLYGLSASNGRVCRPAYKISMPIEGSS